MANLPFFSVIIPALNEEKYLPLLIDDLAQQTVSDFEVIVIDGKSEDKTVPAVNKYQDKINLTILTSDIRNPGYQRNLGAKKASGKYLVFMDADNRIPDYYLEGLRYRVRRRQPQLFTTWCTADSSQSSDKAIATLFNVGIETAKLADNPYSQGALIGCEKNVFIDTGGFDASIRFAEDAEFINRAYKLGYSFIIFRDPRYILSLRRFRQNGKIKTLQQYATINIKNITGIGFDVDKVYPMGGHVFEDQPTTRLLNRIQSALRSVAKKPKILRTLRSILSVNEE